MRALALLAGSALALSSALALAQQGPESLLPPGYDKPAAKAPSQPAPPPVVASGAGQGHSAGAPGAPVAAAPAAPGALPPNLPSLDKLATMSPDQIEALLGNRNKVDVPPAARRAMKRVGVLDENEGGLPGWTLANQPASLVRASLTGNHGRMVSRWGHILLRRALASRLDAPAGMDPSEFVALRTALLVRMGEGDAARALAQDVDVSNYGPALTQAAIDAYVATGDFTGVCPVVIWQGNARKDRQWQLFQGICNAFNGDQARGLQQLDRIAPGADFERIDLMLARKYAGAAGRSSRAVTLDWDGVASMPLARYAMTLAVGVNPPDSLVDQPDPARDSFAAIAPMAPLETRASAADYAGGAGVLSSAAMVDLYGQVLAAGGSGDWTDRASQLQDAYLASTPGDRLAAIKGLWGGAEEPSYYSRQVLTAYAAARLPVSADFGGDAPGLIGSMLTAGLDANAMKWGPVVGDGSLGWGLLALAQPNRAGQVSADQVGTFHDADKSAEGRKTQFLVAGLAGLGRLPVNTANDLAGKYGFAMGQTSRWTQAIDEAANVGNPTLVALLAGLGMQGTGWDKMTARNLFHIVAALERVGLSAEARMIAAEAVARA